MKKLLLTFSLIFACLTAPAATKVEAGYYRVKNYVTGRYIYVNDDKGSVDMGATTVDAGAIKLWKDFTKCCSDPATIIYVDPVTVNGEQKYDLCAQGTSVNALIGEYVKLLYTSSKDAYYCYGTSNGLTKYLGDGEKSSFEPGGISTEVGGDYRLWKLLPVNGSAESFFGLVPEVTANDGKYLSFFASFPYSVNTQGVKLYYINKVDIQLGVAVISEVTGQTVPGGMPLIAKCVGQTAAENKLNIGGTPTINPTDNCLRGVYFDNPSKKHYNRVPYDAQTMRVLSRLADGSLGFVTASLDFLPANRSYLTVPADSPASFKVVTAAEYDAMQTRTITLNYTQLNLKPGQSTQLQATLLPASIADRTVNWTIDNPAVATIAADGTVTAHSVGTATVTAAWAGTTATCQVTVTPVAAQSVTIGGARDVILGQTLQLTATVLPENTTYKDVTWSSSNEIVATISQSGLLTANALGATVITARCGDVQAQCTINVLPVQAASVTLNQTSLNLYLGQSADLKATVLPDNTTDKSVTWTSSNAAVATVDANGHVAAVSLGDAVITVTTTNGMQATCAVKVLPILAESIVLNKTSLSLEIGQSEQLTATVLPDNTTDKSVTWSSSNAAVATVDANGNVTAVTFGDAVITVTTTNGLQATCAVKVLPILAESIVLDKTSLSLEIGQKEQLTATVMPDNATDKSVAWSSSNSSVAAVSADGLVEALTAGTVTITVATTNGLTATCEVTVIDNTQAGIGDINAAARNLSVSVEGCVLHVSGVETYSVYTVDGTLVYHGGEAEISLNNDAVYVVVSGVESVKVMTR